MSEVDPERGEIWWVDFEPAFGSEPRKFRPALILSVPQLGHLPTRIVLPLTTWRPNHANHWNKVLVPRDDLNSLDLDSAADVALLRAVDRRRFGERLGALAPELVAQIAERTVLAIGYGPSA
jgi:mRNA interferase MazF